MVLILLAGDLSKFLQTFFGGILFYNFYYIIYRRDDNNMAIKMIILTFCKLFYVTTFSPFRKTDDTQVT